MRKIGAHVSAAVSLEISFERALKIGADCFQIFVSPPQQWAQTEHETSEIQKFLKAQKSSGIGPNFIHSTYLVNLGTQNPEHLEKSINWLIYGLKMAEKLEMDGVIVHTGSHKGLGMERVLEQVGESIKKVLEGSSPLQSSRKTTYLILENSGGGGGSIGRNFHELGDILKNVQSDRLKVCLDTQHAFATGYDLRTPLGIKNALMEFDEEIGFSNLGVIHANDSKTDFKSGRDRHENIGEGFIGREGFEFLVNHFELKDVPFILEVPGFAGNGPDRENVELLKSLIS